MAVVRTSESIKQEMVTAIQANTTLSALTSESVAALYKYWIELSVSVIYTQYLLWLEFQKEVEAKIASSRWGTLTWYVETAKKFQYGDAVEQLPDNQPYSVVDATKQIVKLASATESGNIVNIKVAKGSPASPSALLPTELVALKAYMGKMKGGGTVLNVISLPADMLRMTATIYYDGQYDLAELQTRVQNAIDNFLFAVPFNGIFLKNRFIDAIDDEVGVVNIDQDTAVLRAVQGVNNIILGSSYQTIAGYMRRDEANFNLTYIAVI